jgi:hypothetical protein
VIRSSFEQLSSAIRLFSRKSVRSTSSLSPRQDDSSFWNIALWITASSCLLTLPSISAIIWSTIFLSAFWPAWPASMCAMNACTPFLATS